MKTVSLLFGGNIGDTKVAFEKASKLLQQKIGPISASSAIYRSKAWGYQSENNFLNQLYLFKSKLSANQILKICLETEHSLGRQRNSNSGYTDRIIDIDILYLDDLIIDTDELTIPHPKLQERLFALMPLNEVIPDFIHPVFQKTNKSLLSLCPDKSIIEKLD